MSAVSSVQPIRIPIEARVTVQPALEGIWFKNEQELESMLEPGRVDQVVESAMNDATGTWRCYNTTLLARHINKCFLSMNQAMLVDIIHQFFLKATVFIQCSFWRDITDRRVANAIVKMLPREVNYLSLSRFSHTELNQHLKFLLENHFKLKSLDLSETGCTDEDLELATQFRDLLYVNLENCKSLTNKGFVHLTHLCITKLNVSGSNIDNETLKSSIGKILTLQSLSIRNGNISDEGLSGLTKLKYIDDLNLRNCSQDKESGDKQITDEGMKYLSHMPLGYIDLTLTEVSKEGYKHLPKKCHIRKAMPLLRA